MTMVMRVLFRWLPCWHSYVAGLFCVDVFVQLANAQNVAMTASGIAIATQGSSGLLVQQGGQQAASHSLPNGVSSFDDVSIDEGNGTLVFALSTSSRQVCSYTLAGDQLNFANCVGGTFQTSPFCGVSALGGTLIISGGTGGLTMFRYDAATGLLTETPEVQNLDLGVIGHPDVVMITANLAALSTDFSSNPRFGTQIALIQGSSVQFVRDFRVQGSLGFTLLVGPANFPLVNAIYRNGAQTFMYTANGPKQVQDPTADGPISTIGGPDGFLAVTVAVNSDSRTVVFGGLIGSQSMVLIYDLSKDPMNPTLLETVSVDGRITSVAAGGDKIAIATQNGNGIQLIESSVGTSPPLADAGSESSVLQKNRQQRVQRLQLHERTRHPSPAFLAASMLELTHSDL